MKKQQKSLQKDLTTMSSNIFPLTLAPVDKTFILKHIAGDSKLQNKLASLGLLPGNEVIVISRLLNGACIIRVKNSRFVLDCKVALKNMVS